MDRRAATKQIRPGASMKPDLSNGVFKRHRVAFDERYVWVETPMVGRPFRARRLMSLYPGLKHMGYSVRPRRGHRKMSKLQKRTRSVCLRASNPQ